MNARDTIRYSLTAIFVIAILILLVGQLLGQPLLVFVETGSMEPTLEPGDGYVAIPAMFAGSPSVDDVILFDAQEIGGGGLTTHRVVDVTDQGYITQGDANPFTDQDGGEPVVADGQVHSVALQIGGSMVKIPQIGGIVETLTGFTDGIVGTVAGALGFDAPDSGTTGIAVLIGGLALLIFSYFTEAGTAIRSRARKRKSLFQNIFVIIAILTLVVIIPLNFSMLLPSGVYSFEIISSTAPSEDPAVIQAGESGEIGYQMQNGGHLPMVTILEPAGPGVEILDGEHTLPRRSTVETSVTMHAPEETGPHLRFVQENRYMMILPPSLIVALHNIHPFVAIGAINLVVIAVISFLSFAFVGSGRERNRSKSRSRKESVLDKLFP